MALQRGNRTYFNPLHGIEWRGNLLPYNTFYAIMSFIIFICMALIFKLCYTFYRAQIHKLEDHEKEIKRRLEERVKRSHVSNGAPVSILKNNSPANSEPKESRRNSNASESRSELRVQFSNDIDSRESTLSPDLDNTVEREHLKAKDNVVEKNCSSL